MLAETAPSPQRAAGWPPVARVISWPSLAFAAPEVHLAEERSVLLMALHEHQFERDCLLPLFEAGEMPGFFFACPCSPRSGAGEVPRTLRREDGGVNAIRRSKCLAAQYSGNKSTGLRSTGVW